MGYRPPLLRVCGHSGERVIDVRLTEVATGVEVRFWPAPASLPREDGATTRAFQPVRGGERVRPDGRRAKRWSIDHTFLGGESYGSAWNPAAVWRPPVDIDRDLQRWMDADPPAALVLTAAGSIAGGALPSDWPALHAPVFVESYRPAWGTGDDLAASLALVELRPLLIAADESATSPTGGSSSAAPAATGAYHVYGGYRTAADAPLDSYTVQDADTLSSIAALPRVYGDASKWPALFDANKDRIPGFDGPDVILPGWSLVIPR